MFVSGLRDVDEANQEEIERDHVSQLTNIK